MFDPDSSLADEDGLREDVLTALGRLDMTVMRYPGGNFVSSYHWLDGVGPPERRPTLRDPNWQSIEPNRFGTDEFVRVCRKMGWEPQLTVNLGTGSPEEAANWVEYCNLPAGTKYADMRRENGSDDPFGVKLWFLGNEMDGPWQTGHVPAEQYACRADQAAAMMKRTDGDIALVACGTCNTELSTYMEWDREVLEYLGDNVDFISAHRYVKKEEDDSPDFLAAAAGIDRQIMEMDSACRFVQAKRRSTKRIFLCFDEWNVWYKTKGQFSRGRAQFAPAMYEEIYNLEDALVVAGILGSFIRHADFVKIANIAQIVNVLAPIVTKDDALLIQSIFYPFEMYSRRRKGTSLTTSVSGPRYESRNYGEAPYVDASAILDDRRLHVFLTNRSLDDPAVVKLEPAGMNAAGLHDAEILTGPDSGAANSFDEPDTVRSRPFEEAEFKEGRMTIELPPLSFAALTVKLDR